MTVCVFQHSLKDFYFILFKKMILHFIFFKIYLLVCFWLWRIFVVAQTFL